MPLPYYLSKRFATPGSTLNYYQRHKTMLPTVLQYCSYDNSHMGYRLHSSRVFKTYY